jgi:hypothetical protein
MIFRSDGMLIQVRKFWRIKYFFRWFHNYKMVKEKEEEPRNTSD